MDVREFCLIKKARLRNLHLVDGLLELKLDFLHVVFEFDLLVIGSLVKFLL